MAFPIDSPTAQPTYLIDLLKNAASNQPENGFLFLEDGLDKPATRVTYAELYAKAKDNARRLIDAGIVRRGEKVIIYFDNHEDNILYFWSVISAGGICAVLNPVSNEPKTAAGQLDNVKSLFGGTPILTSHKLSSILASRKLNVQSVEDVDRRKAIDSGLPSPAESTTDDARSIAAILFTSGSTGLSKAVEYTNGQLIASVQAKSQYLSTHGKTFMSWVSFDHSACFCEVHLQALYTGSDQLFVPASELVQTPWQFFQVLSTYKIGYTFIPNFFLAAAVESLTKQDREALDLNLSNLSVVMVGGEANRTKTLQAADNVMRSYGAPAHSLKAAYGLSETCSACYYNLETPEYDLKEGNIFATVGKPLPGLEMKLLDDDGVEQTTGEGTIHLRGNVIFNGYYANPEATTKAIAADGWMNTGDIGRLDQDGNLQLLGRSKEVLILNGNNFSSFEIEYAIETCGILGLEVSYTAVFSTWSEERSSEAPVVLFHPTEAAIGPKHMSSTLHAINKAVFSVCAQKALRVIPLPKALLPKSTIGKLSRAKLRQSFENGDLDDYIMDNLVSGVDALKSTCLKLADASPLQQEIAQIYSSIVNAPASDLLGSDALLSSGINSLGFMRLKKALEKGLKIHQEIPMPLLIRCHSIADLEHELTLIGTVSNEYDPIVPLATHGSRQTLFLLHPGAGEFLCWMGLLPYLPDRPIYALRAKGLHPGEGTFDGIDDLLSCYYTAMRRIQPKGPYAMLGYCFGGLLSFELAKMFEADGQEVVFCGGIDNPPSLKSTIGQVRYRSLMIDVLPVVTDYTPEQARAFAEETAGLNDEQFYALLFTKFSPEFIDQMDITIPRLQAFGRVEDCMRLIAAQYEPTGSIATTDIFCADPMPHFGATPEVWKRDVLGEWRSFVKDANVRFHHVGGNHISLIKEPLIKDFQKSVNDALAARGI
ncbi:Putative AMP-dependent synthetase/ligase, thioesterase, phosphopantetheine binding ACP [Septoria linicola]|uniref:AMP-dependent synthetase/ligase, thioesterase, phosphopantetheine binding ACP n=1 Tax=Septoria linicola TaxID=215465 RepID=A0A9Q9AH76_9PEZI|nr:putative AMP-dependent synthetase/ligase, thioesterase, phosphopantetheine binding ACP [Septoria linicola]USW49025.1 Putative AMP-dependent synthetase/ligase, thioesterase, phosphopantetheine binding ACP [Septoria linicola]